VSWADVLNAGKKPRHSVVIHEMARKLDMLDGGANGFAPLHRRTTQKNVGFETPAERFQQAALTVLDRPP
jgi:Mlc titration factor MtfA (ptsG expression regulator)